MLLLLRLSISLFSSYLYLLFLCFFFFFLFLTGGDVGQRFPRCEQVMLLLVGHVDSRNK